MTKKTRTEEIHYLGQMLGATAGGDIGRIKAIIKRLRVLGKEKG